MGGTWGGMAGSVAATFNYRVERQKTKIGELTNGGSNGPDYFFKGKTVGTGGRDDGW